MFSLKNKKDSQAYKGQSVLMTVDFESLSIFNDVKVGMFCLNSKSDKKGIVTFIDTNNLRLQITPLEVNDSFSGDKNPGIFSYDDEVFFTAEPYFLRMLFDDIANVPVLDPTDTTQWDAFFEFEEGSFTVAYVTDNEVGCEVWLGGGGSNQALIDSIFSGNNDIINFIDEGGIFSSMDGNKQFRDSSVVEVSLPNVINLNGVTFAGCSSLKYISLPKLTTLSGRFSFRQCTSLTSVSLPSLTAILGDATFLDSTGIQEIYLPLLETTTNPGATFQNCNSLKKLYMPRWVDIINETDFGFNQTNQDIDLTISLALMESSVHPTIPSIQYLLQNNNVTLTTV